MKKIMPFVPLIGLFLGGCTMDRPTAPEDVAAEAGLESSTKTAEFGGAAVQDFAGDLEDIPVRVLPGFSDRSAADELERLLGELTMHLAARDHSAISAVIAQAREVIQPSVGDPADLAYIHLVLENIEAMIQ